MHLYPSIKWDCRIHILEPTRALPFNLSFFYVSARNMLSQSFISLIVYPHNLFLDKPLLNGFMASSLFIFILKFSCVLHMLLMCIFLMNSNPETKVMFFLLSNIMTLQSIKSSLIVVLFPIKNIFQMSPINQTH